MGAWGGVRGARHTVASVLPLPVTSVTVHRTDIPVDLTFCERDSHPFEPLTSSSTIPAGGDELRRREHDLVRQLRHHSYPGMAPLLESHVDWDVCLADSPKAEATTCNVLPALPTIHVMRLAETMTCRGHQKQSDVDLLVFNG